MDLKVINEIKKMKNRMKSLSLDLQQGLNISLIYMNYIILIIVGKLPFKLGTYLCSALFEEILSYSVVDLF